MTWMILNNGAEHHFVSSALNNPADSYDINTIAHSLAQINRFTGHCVRPYSVAEHSLLVAQFAANEGASAIVQLAALMHDAHESIVGDMASPVKWTIGEVWSDFELQEAYRLHWALGLRSAMHSHRARIRRWDLIALATERRDLTAFNPKINAPWPILDNPAAPIFPASGVALMKDWRCSWKWYEWRGQFKAEYHRLHALVKEDAAKLLAAEGPTQ